MSEQKYGFALTAGKGFHMRFANGYGISVQFGVTNYCDNRSNKYEDVEKFINESGRYIELYRNSNTAEVAIFDPLGKFVPDEKGHNVRGWQTADQVLALMVKYAAIKP